MWVWLGINSFSMGKTLCRGTASTERRGGVRGGGNASTEKTGLEPEVAREGGTSNNQL